MTDAVFIDHPGTGVSRLAFNRPERRSPLDTETRVAMLAGLDTALSDPAIRVVIITGNGGTFCAGGDISAMGSRDERAGAERMYQNHLLARRIGRAEKPIIAAVEGFAFGAGAGIALLCDAIIAGESASMGFSFFRVGLVPDYGIAHSLPQRVGHAKAKLMLLRAQTVKSEEALRIGLFDQVVPDKNVQSAALELAAELAAQPAHAVAVTKRLLLAEPQGFDAALDLERTSQVLSFLSADHREGVAAFREKRAPKFD
jgi:2-(1,2-epoxy-1,2-dihydrophenyl)acetyl-CoA isomerase